jgi:hypothetical protein
MTASRYRFSRREIARHKCIGCGINVIRAGDYCMLRNEIWQGTLGLKWQDNMCVACIEGRIGRQLTISDFIAFPSVERFRISDALRNRLGFDKPKRRRLKRRITARCLAR